MSNADWRADFKQADRNKEVRRIAGVLASLEPGARPGSKLRLAMQFEDSVFKGAESLDDYIKKLNKRLRKLQKNYRPPEDSGQSERARALEELRTQHGESITYCLKHASKAIREMKDRHGSEKALQLRQHLESCKQWAVDLGLLPNTKPNITMSDDHYDKLKSAIEKRLENVRSHVVKLADPEQFFAETLERAEEDCRGKGSRVLAVNVQKRYGQLHKVEMKPQEIFAESMKASCAAVPLSTRSQRNNEQASLIWLQKMRAASTAALAFLGADDKSSMPKGTLTKLNDIANEGAKFVKEVLNNRRKDQKPVAVSLEDAWIKELRIRNENTGSTAQQAKKPLVIQSKFLFVPGRKTPPNLLPVFRMKQATLVRPPPNGEGSHVILHFGNAFVMTVYFCPLTVRLTAATDHNQSVEKYHGMQCAPWQSLSDNLVERDDLTVWGAKGNYATLGHVVEERLRDASANATRVIRQLFANNIKANAADFEIEICEGTALVEFLQLARTTFIPDWQDADP